VAHSIGGQLIFEVAQGAGANDITEAMRLNANLSAVFASTVSGAFNGTLGATTPAAIAGTTIAASTASDALTLVFASRNTSAGTSAVNRSGFGNNASAVAFTFDVYGSNHATKPNHVEFFNNFDTTFSLGTGATADLTFVAGGGATFTKTFTSTGDLTVGASKFNVTASSGDLQMDGDLTVTGGNAGIGAAPSANADLKLEAGRLMLKESLTPTADSGYGKVYCKDTDELFFQDGDGVEREVVLSDHASMLFHASETVTIDYPNVFNRVCCFTTNGPATISTADQANDRLVFGATTTYDVKHTMEGSINAAAQLMALTVFSVSQTTATITGITQANPGVVTTAAAHGYSNGDKVKFADIVGMIELNNRIFRVNNVTSDTFEIQDLSPANFNTGGLTAYDSGGTTQKAVSTGSHTHQTYPNNQRTATCGFYLFEATAGDAVELYVANDTGTTDFNMESSRVFIEAV